MDTLVHSRGTQTKVFSISPSPKSKLQALLASSPPPCLLLEVLTWTERHTELRYARSIWRLSPLWIREVSLSEATQDSPSPLALTLAVPRSSHCSLHFSLGPCSVSRVWRMCEQGNKFLFLQTLFSLSSGICLLGQKILLYSWAISL